MQSSLRENIYKALSYLNSEQDIYESLSKNNYLRGYISLQKHFMNLDMGDYDDVLTGAYAVYGWMPTVLKYPPSERALEGLVGLIQAGREQGPKLNLGPWALSLQCINNSVVGTSKFLHFAAPTVFPIWDSVVARSLDHRHAYSTPPLYTGYFEAVHAWCDDPECEFPQSYMTSVGKIEDLRNATRLRLLELALFTVGKMKR